MRYFKYYILFSLLTFSLSAYSKSDSCKKMEKEFVASQLVLNELHDTKNAFSILQHGSIARTIYNKPKCLSEKNYLRYMDSYLMLMLKAERNYGSPTVVDKLVKAYPKHANFHRLLGDFYRKLFKEKKRATFRDQALESYKHYMALRQKVSNDIYSYVKNSGLEKADSTWGTRINPKGSIPKSGFKAFYFNVNEPKNIIASEKVNSISVNYAYESFHGIDSHKFGAYWVGKVDFKKDEKKVISVDLSRSKVRIIVDGLVLYEGESRTEIPYLFKKGSHKIEVEFLNQWHTTDLMVNILPYTKKYTLKEIEEELKALSPEKFEFWYVGVYESRNKNHQIDLNIKKSTKPIVLLLNGYSSVVWNINNPHKTKIAAVILNGTKTLSSVNGLDIKTKLIYSKERILGGYSLPKECSCDSGYYNCSSGFQAHSITRMFPTKKIRGFSGKYGAKILEVPKIIMNDAKYLEIEKIMKTRKEGRSECIRDATLKFDEVFKK